MHGEIMPGAITGEIMDMIYSLHPAASEEWPEQGVRMVLLKSRRLGSGVKTYLLKKDPNGKIIASETFVPASVLALSSGSHREVITSITGLTPEH